MDDGLGRPQSIAPKAVLQWMLSALPQLWTDDGLSWKADLSRMQISRSEGGLTFVLLLQSNRWNRTGEPVHCWPQWQIKSRRWTAWVKQTRPSWRPDPTRGPHVGDYVRDLTSDGKGFSSWEFPLPLRGQADLHVPLADLRANVGPIFRAAPDIDQLAHLIEETPALQGHVVPLCWLEYFSAHGRADLAQDILVKHWTHGPEAYVIGVATAYRNLKSGRDASADHHHYRSIASKIAELGLRIP